MRLLLPITIVFFLAGTAQAGTCYQQLKEGDTMEEVLDACGEPTHRKDLGSDMKVKGQDAGQARMLTIEHSRTETLWVYENDQEIYVRFENGRLVEKELKKKE